MDITSSSRTVLLPRPINGSNHIQLSATNGHCEHNNLNTGITKAVQPTPPSVRIMASGRCTAVFSSGRRKVPCDCPQGIFGIQQGAHDDPECQDCAHPLSQHEDLPLDPDFEVSEQSEPGESGLSQGLESHHLSDQSSYDAASLLEEADSQSSRVGSREVTLILHCLRGSTGKHLKSQRKGLDP